MPTRDEKERPTLEVLPELAIVVVGGPPALLTAANRTAETLGGRVEGVELQDAATCVAATRPFAILVSAVVYAFDRAEFDALARDVQATIIAVETEGRATGELEDRVMARVAAAFRAKFKGR